MNCQTSGGVSDISLTKNGQFNISSPPSQSAFPLRFYWIARSSVWTDPGGFGWGWLWLDHGWLAWPKMVGCCLASNFGQVLGGRNTQLSRVLQFPGTWRCLSKETSCTICTQNRTNNMVVGGSSSCMRPDYWLQREGGSRCHIFIEEATFVGWSVGSKSSFAWEYVLLTNRSFTVFACFTSCLPPIERGMFVSLEHMWLILLTHLKVSDYSVFPTIYVLRLGAFPHLVGACYFFVSITCL